jgi:hypothetical protein
LIQIQAKSVGVSKDKKGKKINKEEQKRLKQEKKAQVILSNICI